MADLEISQEFRRRIEEYRRETDRVIERGKALSEFKDFRPAHRRLQLLIKRRKEIGQWPPTGDEVDDDRELQDVMAAVHAEEIADQLTGPVFKAVVAMQKRRDKSAVDKVMQRCQAQRERKRQVQHRLFTDRVQKRGILNERKRK
jgi:hypothetical protein